MHHYVPGRVREYSIPGSLYNENSRFFRTGNGRRSGTIRYGTRVRPAPLWWRTERLSVICVGKDILDTSLMLGPTDLPEQQMVG